MTTPILPSGKIDLTKAVELRLKKGMSYADIGRFFGVSRDTARLALKRFNDMLVAPAEVTAYQASKAEILENVELQLLSDLTDTDRRQKASLNNVAYALNTVANLTRLERGQSTANISYIDMTKSLEEIQAQRKQLQEALESYGPGVQLQEDGQGR